VVPAENSVAFYLALRKSSVPAELHIFLKTPHTASASIWLIPPSAGGIVSSCTGLGKENGFQVLFKSADGTPGCILRIVRFRRLPSTCHRIRVEM
jgi:hypothetical protein